MNRKQRRIAQAKDKPGAIIRVNGKSYGIVEAITLAVKENARRNFQAAVDLYQQIATKIPDHPEIQNNLACALRELARHDEALLSYDKAVALKPGYAVAHSNRAVTLQELRQYDEALISCEKALALKPDYAEGYHTKGDILLNKGDMQAAEQMFKKALELNPMLANPLYGLVHMRKCKDTDQAYAKHIQMLLDNPDTSSSDKELLYFSLAKIYDDCGQYDEAFECFRQANQLCNALVSYDAEKVSNATDEIIGVFSKEFLANPFPLASDSQAPLFIVGMPRSGTTLMAGILSNHHAIDNAGELPTMINRLAELRIGNHVYPQTAKHMTAAIASRLIDEYEGRLRRDVVTNSAYIIDKHPLNFRNLGYIAMLFPNAKIINCTRDPLDTCLSNYFQYFSLFYDYAFDLKNIAHFYGEYAKLMRHWRKVLPSHMIDVSYEELITNTEQTTNKILDFLGLEWDDRCLTPHTNPHAVETASRWQVRQPIYRQSVERWRHYEKHLGPLKEILPLAE